MTNARLSNALRMDAFNLWPGATLLTDPNPPHPLSLPEEVLDEINPEADEVWVVTHVERDPEAENVHVWARRGDLDTYLLRTSFMFHYTQEVTVIGNVVNFADPDDNNWGSR